MGIVADQISSMVAALEDQKTDLEIEVSALNVQIITLKSKVTELENKVKVLETPTPAPAVSTNKVGKPHLFRLAYSDAAAAASVADRYDVIVMNPDAGINVAAAKAKNPNVKVLAYLNASLVQPGTSSDNVTRFPSAQVLPSWYLTDISGSKITQWQAGNYLVDFGLPAYQTAWLNWAKVKLAGFDGVFIDDVNWHADKGSAIPVKYPNDAAYLTAMGTFVASVGPALKVLGKLVYANIGGARDDGSAPRWTVGMGIKVWTAWLTYLDGAMHEHFMFDSDHTGTLFQRNLDLMTVATGFNKSVLIRLAGSGDVEVDPTFALAAYMLIADGKHMFSGSKFTNPAYPSSYVRDLGAPAGTYTVSNGIYKRVFANGVVTINTTVSPATAVIQ